MNRGSAILDGVARSKYLQRWPAPWALCTLSSRCAADVLPEFRRSGVSRSSLLESKHVLVAPGVSFNVPYRNAFRITNLPEPPIINTVFARIEELLDSQAAAGPDLQVVAASKSQHH